MPIRAFSFIFFFIFLDLSSYAQNTSKSQKLYESDKNHVAFAPVLDSLFFKGDYEQSLSVVKKDTVINQEMYLYRLAAVYARLGVVDSAFLYLNQYIDISWDDRIIVVDKTWDLLRKDTLRWHSITDKIERLYLNELDSGLNRELALELFYMGITDQKHRAYRQYTEYSGEKAEKEFHELTGRFEEIIAKYGFPGISMVGKLGNSSLFFIYQHLHPDLLIKYYPLIEQCYQQHDIQPWHYAMATDRYLTWKNKKQIYGTQLVQNNKTQKKFPGQYILWPVEDFKHINERRKEMGLGTVEDYIKAYNGYIPPEYYQGKGKLSLVR